MDTPKDEVVTWMLWCNRSQRVIKRWDAEHRDKVSRI